MSEHEDVRVEYHKNGNKRVERHYKDGVQVLFGDDMELRELSINPKK